MTTEQRVLIVITYTQTQSIAAVQNAFRVRFPGRNSPAKSTVRRNIWKNLSTGTSLKRNKGNSGRQGTARSTENINAVRALLQQNPRDGIVRRNPIGISS